MAGIKNKRVRAGIAKGDVNRVDAGIKRLVKALKQAAAEEESRRGRPAYVTEGLTVTLGARAEGANVPDGLRVPPSQ